MLLLGIDIGTSSVKVSIVDAQTQQAVASAQYPETEADILAPQSGWAEQSPDSWWQFTRQALAATHASGKYNPQDIAAIGIAYQMHGLVVVNEKQQALRNSIIWCDSRAVEIGNKAFATIGEQQCLSCLLNSPGNFTASKLAWVKENEPDIYNQIHKIMLPGDFIAMQLTGEVTTSISALSEGVFWDFKADTFSKDVFDYFGFNNSVIPDIHPVFSSHGTVSAAVAAELSLKPGIPVSYKAGDQPNNALSLNVLEPGEVAATAGTSGVIYGVTDTLLHDRMSRVNSFAHVNYMPDDKKVGVLLCINGTGIQNKWIRTITGSTKSYNELNQEAAAIPAGSEGLFVLPFGNGAERMLNNAMANAHIHGIDFNKHTAAHLYRAGQEGIAFAFRYGLDIMRENGMQPSVIRAGKANMFLSDIFLQAFVNATNTPVELYNSDGSIGAALGAGIGAGIFKNAKEAFSQLKPLQLVQPTQAGVYDALYAQWKKHLLQQLNIL